MKHQEQENFNAELHFKLLEEKKKLTEREQENSMLELRVEELSGAKSRGHTCFSWNAEVCWRRQQPDLDRDAARIQDGFADKTMKSQT